MSLTIDELTIARRAVMRQIEATEDQRALATREVTRAAALMDVSADDESRVLREQRAIYTAQISLLSAVYVALGDEIEALR